MKAYAEYAHPHFGGKRYFDAELTAYLQEVLGDEIAQYSVEAITKRIEAHAQTRVPVGTGAITQCPPNMVYYCNGYYNIATRTFEPYRDDQYIFKTLDFDFDEELLTAPPPTPIFDRLQDDQGWPEDKRRSFRIMLGAFLCNYTDHQKIFVLHGERRTSKTLTINKLVIPFAYLPVTFKSEDFERSVAGYQFANVFVNDESLPTAVSRMKKYINTFVGKTEMSLRQLYKNDAKVTFHANLIIAHNGQPQLFDKEGNTGTKIIYYNFPHSMQGKEKLSYEKGLFDERKAVAHRCKAEFLAELDNAEADNRLIDLEHAECREMRTTIAVSDCELDYNVTDLICVTGDKNDVVEERRLVKLVRDANPDAYTYTNDYKIRRMLSDSLTPFGVRSSRRIVNGKQQRCFVGVAIKIDNCLKYSELPFVPQTSPTQPEPTQSASTQQIDSDPEQPDRQEGEPFECVDKVWLEIHELLANYVSPFQHDEEFYDDELPACLPDDTVVEPCSAPMQPTSTHDESLSLVEQQRQAFEHTLQLNAPQQGTWEQAVERQRLEFERHLASTTVRTGD